LLLEGGWVKRDDVEKALQEQQGCEEKIGRILVEKGVVSERTLLEALSHQLCVPMVEIGEAMEDPEVISLIPYAVAKQYRALPLRRTEKILHVAMAEPQDQEAIQALQFAIGMRIQAGLCSDREIDIAIEQYYGVEEVVDKIVRNVAKEANLEEVETDVIPDPDLRDDGSGVRRKGEQGPSSVAPIVRFVHLILLEAVRKEASDIHFEPGRKALQVRFRLDGVLRQRMSIPRYLQQSVLSRLKVMARMDIANKRTPQDGGIRFQVEGRRLDLRVSSLPTFFGEKIVLRILDQSENNVTLSGLGLSDDDCRRLEGCFRKPQGMILVTGPTGSGKSTTLRCILKALCSEGVNIMTVEDPMEYELEGINQVQVSRESGLSFADSLRAILRQDPNVIMVGEIRDKETAEVAFRAALTGHLVLSTLHTNDSVSTITRLVDMEVPRFLIGSALLAVVSQRLVRKVCTACARAEAIDPVRLEAWKGVAPAQESWKVGEGCSRCEYTGSKGRVGIYELFVLSSENRELIAQGGSEGEILRLAKAQGMQTLFQDALQKLRKGMTSFQEVSSVVKWEEAGSGSSGSVDPSAGNRTKAGENASSRRKIVYAEDDPGVREAVCLTLETLSCDVFPAEDGQEAWEEVVRHLPDLIITDVNMPRMDGLGLLEKIRSDLRTAFIPVILLTAKNRCEDRMKGFLLGGDDYIEKPFDHRELLVRAKRCMDRVTA